jgi:hypothetical protein
MKKLLKIFFMAVLLIGQGLQAQEEKPEPSLSLQYFNLNAKLQYLKVKALVKEDGKLQPVKGAVLALYLDEAMAENLLGKLKTDEKGEAKTTIPPALKEKWNLSPNHKFIAASEANKKFAESTTELEIAKAKIVIDTLNEDGARKVTAQVLAHDSSGWMPVKDVELKIGVRRLGGDLKMGEEETYTTDSLGYVSGEFKLDSLPSLDAKNNIVLVAKTEDNDLYGNLSVEMSVPWGRYAKAQLLQQDQWFNHRSLWATRTKTPIWLLLMAYSIIVAVWGVIVYLLFQLLKIKKLGKVPGRSSKTAARTLEAADY